MHTRFIYRQITSSLKQTIVFVACVALSLVTLVSLGGFGESVNRSLLRDARRLLAGDVILETGFPYDDVLQVELAAVTAEPGVELVNIYEFISIVRQTDGEETLLSELKVVDPGYPFYGEVELASTRPFNDVLQPGSIIVGRNLLERLGLEIGDDLFVGSTTLTIADVLVSEPDQPVDFFVLGPRILIHSADLDSLNLIREGSRVFYKTLLKVPDETQVDVVAERLTAAADERRVEVNTFRTNQSAVQGFFDNFLTFLSLIGIFTLMLAGIGIQSSLTAFLKERESTIAILRTFGATSQFVIRQFAVVTATLGFIGTAIGLLLGLVMQLIFPIVFAPFLPPQVEFIISLRALGEGLLLGLFVVSAFTFIPLYQTQDLKPNFIFRKEAIPTPRTWTFYITLTTIIFFFIGMIFWYLRNPERTAWFAAGVVGLVLITALLTQGALRLLRNRRLKPLDARQALRGLFRPRNATAAIIVTLSTSLAVLFTIYLIERNLDATFVEAYPDDAPNLFILDIQPDQRADVEAALAAEEQISDPNFVPIVQGRIRTINGEPIEARDRSEESADDDDRDGPVRLDGEFALTYRDDLVLGERLEAGRTLFRDDGSDVAQVSVSSEMLNQYPFALGDRIVFEIQGVPLEAEVVSLRGFNDTESGFSPRFTFVMREQDLGRAPQTIIGTASAEQSLIPQLQNRLVADYPNLTIIDVSNAVDSLATLVGDITVVIRFFMLFSVVAGILIIISSVLATRFARIQEAVYFKVLGATGRFVLRVFTLENIFIGLLSALLALFLSQLAGYLLITLVFELTYRPFLLSSILLLLGTVILVTAVGLLASASILRQKPITFLREQSAA